jgi:hypothetical protein
MYIRDTSRHDWKLSRLPLSCHELEQEAPETEALCELASAAKMERIANCVPERLSQSENRWHFVGM